MSPSGASDLKNRPPGSEPGGSAAAQVLAGGGEMGALMRVLDWSKTPVGAIETWPQSLKTILSTLLHSTFGTMVAWGPDLTHFYNDAYRPILGTTKHPSLGQRVPDVFPEIWDTIGPLFEGVMQGHAVGFEDLLVPLDRHGFLEECTFTFAYTPIRDETGGVGGVLVTVSETTMRLVQERRLRALRDLALHVARASDEAQAWEGSARTLSQNDADVPFALLYALDGDGRQLRLAGATADAPEAAAPAQIRLDAADEGGWPLAGALAGGAPLLVDDVRRRFGDHPGRKWPEPVERALILPIRRAGAMTAYGALVMGLSPRRPLDEGYRDFCGLVADQIAAAIANARTLTEERQRAESLRELDRAKNIFFSNVSHEFRTPLTLMLGPLEDALASPSQALGGEDLRAVHRNALRLLKLVNALLDFSRAEAGRAQADHRPTDLAALTRDLASAFHSAVERGGLAFEVDCPPLPDPVMVDRDMWEKIVLNLISNAFKFTLQGAIRVQLRAVDGEARLVVSDTGIGIAEADLPHVFERFRTVRGAGGRTQEGSGIGLALVHELVHLHGGRVSVESQLGKGTTFTVALPAARSASGLAAAGATSQKPADPTRQAYVLEALRWLPDPVAAGHDVPPVNDVRAAAAAPEARPHIVVADDNADMREYIGRLLAGRWVVHPVADGVQALAAIRQRRPDLVLTDVMMPNLDGFGLLRALREDPETAGIPVIMLSARAGEESRVDGLQAGADDYLPKPFSAKELVARVSTHLELGRMRKQAESASRAKDEFLAILGHELRNPLAPMLTSLRLLEMKGIRAPELEVLERQIGALIRLVDDLMDVSRITRGKIELRKSRFELSRVVVQGLETASPLLEQRRHRVELQVPVEGLPVEGDPDRLSQVVSNLLTNAAKYSDAGSAIQVTTERIDGRVQLRIRDHGIGIPAQMLTQVFEMFVQQPQALDRAKGGIGLGLTIVRSLVELHEGRVWATSDGPGTGSEFVVELPLASTEAMGERPAALPRVDPPALSASGQARILIVDDNHDAAESLAEFLTECGHLVRTAHDGPSGIELAAWFKPTVCLVDIGLPVMDGYEVARRLRTLEGLPPGVRLMAITGYGQAGDRQRSSEAGFDDHLVKPVDLERLARSLSK